MILILMDGLRHERLEGWIGQWLKIHPDWFRSGYEHRSNAVNDIARYIIREVGNRGDITLPSFRAYCDENDLVTILRSQLDTKMR